MSFLKALGIIIAFGGAFMLSYGLIEPLFHQMNTDASQLWIIFGSIVLTGGVIIIVKNR